jgi:hypothetical protein
LKFDSRGAVPATSGRNYSIIQEIELSAMGCSHNAKFVIAITIVSTTQKNIVMMFNYRTAKRMYKRLNNMIRRGDRSRRTAEIIGTSHQNFLDWIEFQFTESMNWENYGSVWCFEHCCPLSAFDLTNEEELKKAMNWMNIRPYCKIRNSEKKASIDPWLSVFQQIKAKKFLNEKTNS